MEKVANGSEVWVAVGTEDRQEFLHATVTSRNGSIVKVRSAKGKLTVDLDDPESAGVLFRANPRVVSDLTGLQYFHIPGMLHNLSERSMKDEPYTFLGGSVLVAVNPLKPIDAPKGAKGTPKALGAAHPYAIAETAYQQLTFSVSRDGDAVQNQSIIVGGESGAGKTESSKMVMKHLVERSIKNGAQNADLDERLLGSNPILEAFGNAATKRNSNSSRFGKFMKLHFKKIPKSREMEIWGASVETYLLERSRVTAHSEGERTFHIFYQLVNGASKAAKKSLDLDRSFEYLKPQKSQDLGGGRKVRPKSMAKLDQLGKDDKNNFKMLCKALTTVGVAEGTGSGDVVGQDDVFGVLAALLHLGNVKFAEKEGAHGDEAEVTNPDVMAKAASLLGLTGDALSRLFIERKVKAVGEEIVAKRDADSAKLALDAVVKAVYTQAFDWLNTRITASLSENDDYQSYPFIGVLDIFGFETFAKNDFEQLLINYTNEALQNTFNMQIFEAEADLYVREGLLVDSADRQTPPNNDATMQLLGGVRGDKNQPGVLAYIDAETKSPQASDDKLNSALHRAYQGNAFFGKTHPRDTKHCFIIEHYAGAVKYTVGSFIEKNIDKLPDEVGELLGGSDKAMVVQMFSAAAAGAAQPEAEPQGFGASKASAAARAMKKATSTISGRFKLQIEELIETIAATKASFIRCIKPNARMERGSSPEWFNSPYVMNQLQNLSIPQTAEVLKGGLPTRIPFDQLTESYLAVMPDDAIAAWRSLGQGDERLFVKALFFAFEIAPSTYKMGLTRVFFKSGMLDALNEVLDAAAAGSVGDAHVRRFKQSFARSIWRRAVAKVIAVNAFTQMLADTRSRKSAITILQRLAKRQYEMAKAREELERRREEKKLREAEEARRKAEEQRRKEERIRKEREAAEKAAHAEEAARLRQEELEAAEMRRQAEETAAAASAAAEAAARAQIALEEEATAALAREQEEQQKVIEELGSAEAFEEQVVVEKKKAVRFALPAAEEEAPSAAEITTRAKAEMRKSRAPAKGAAPQEEPEAAPNVFTEVRFKEVQIKQPKASPFACLFGGGKPRDAVPDPFESGDDWQECQIIITGYELRYFRSLQADKRGNPKGVDKIGSVELDPALTDMTVIDNGPDEVMRFTARRSGGGGRYVFFNLMNQDNHELLNAYKDAVATFQKERTMAAQFEAGDLGGNKAGQGGQSQGTDMDMYKAWLATAVITQAEFDVLRNQQITVDTEYLNEDLSKYGEDGAVDYRVVCVGCSDVYFIVPGAEKETPHCVNCGEKLPKAVEVDAGIVALRIAARERLAVAAKSASDYPCIFGVNGAQFLVDAPVVEEVLYTATMERVYRFDFPVKNFDDDTLVGQFTFGASWSQWKFFLGNLASPPAEIKHKLDEAGRASLPAFPESPQVSGAKARADVRLPLIADFVRDLIAASYDIPGFFELPPTHRFFNLPDDTSVASLTEVSVLQPDQLRLVTELVDSIQARIAMINDIVSEHGPGAGNLSGISPDVDALRGVVDAVRSTGDPEIVYSDPDLEELSDDDKAAMVNMAHSLMESITEILAIFA